MLAALALVASLLAPCEMYGRVWVVSSAAHADYRVWVASSAGQADARVRWVKRTPTRAGEWQRVDNARVADFRVFFTARRVDADFVIAYDATWPGCPGRARD